MDKLGHGDLDSNEKFNVLLTCRKKKQVTKKKEGKIF